MKARVCVLRLIDGVRVERRRRMNAALSSLRVDNIWPTADADQQ